MWKFLLFALLVGLAIGTTVPITQPVYQMCKPGEAHAITFPDRSFVCKPGPARRPQCQWFFRKSVATPFLCPNNGYKSGWIEFLPYALNVCCTEPGLYKKDCITYEANQGEPAPLPSDRVIVQGDSFNGGRTFVRTICRYAGYPRRNSKRQAFYKRGHKIN